MSSTFRAVTRELPLQDSAALEVEADGAPYCRVPGPRVRLVADPRMQGGATADSTPAPVSSSPERGSHGTATGYAPTAFVYGPLKRAIDLVLGSTLLVFASPIILVAAAAIRIETPGSPFFIQTRLGKDGKPFRICKLRGMYRDAKVRFPSYYDFSCKPGLDFWFHHEVDPRVTRIGRFLRRTSVDELPNLWNVVCGDMSLVGPRPEIPEVLALYGAHRQEYLSVKPGVTCLSKCTGRDRLSKRETVEYDIEYVRKRGLRLDVSILWRTFRSVVLRRDVF